MLPLTPLEKDLRALAREHIAQGRLPREAASRLWGGHGTGEPCTLCGHPIHPDQVEFEVDDGSDGPVQTFRLHATCQFAWQLECNTLKNHA